MEYPKILLMIGAKNARPFLFNVANIILNLDYPKDKLSVIILDNDSSDDTYHHAFENIMPLLHEAGINVTIDKHDTGFNFGYENRHLPEIQDQRLAAIAEIQQYMIDGYLKDNDYACLVDIHTIFWPKDIFQRLIAHGKDLTTVSWRLPDGSWYDSGSMTPDGVLLCNSNHQGLVKLGRTNCKFLYKRSIFDSGLKFGNVAHQEGTMSVSELAKRGFGVYMDASIHCIHGYVNGMEPFKK
jgi:hypothetical protein